MSSSSQAANAMSHDRHDRITIAALASGDLVGQELARARALLADCDACRRLHGDLLAIAAAVREVPPMERPADRAFRLSADDARRVVRGARWRAGLRPFGAARGPLIRPMAATLMTMGLAVLIISAQPLLHLGAAGAAPQDAGFLPTTSLPLLVPAPPEGFRAADSPDGSADSPDGSADSPDGSASSGPASGTRERAADTSPEVGTAAADEAATPVPTEDSSSVPVLGAVLLVAGVALFVLHRLALRLR